MGNRRWRVRRSVGHSDRLVALPDEGSPSHDRRDPEYDGYIRVEPQSPKPMQDALPDVVVSPVELRICPLCGRKSTFQLGPKVLLFTYAPEIGGYLFTVWTAIA